MVGEEIKFDEDVELSLCCLALKVSWMLKRKIEGRTLSCMEHSSLCSFVSESRFK